MAVDLQAHRLVIAMGPLGLTDADVADIIRGALWGSLFFFKLGRHEATI